MIVFHDHHMTISLDYKMYSDPSAYISKFKHKFERTKSKTELDTHSHTPESLPSHSTLSETHNLQPIEHKMKQKLQEEKSRETYDIDHLIDKWRGDVSDQEKKSEISRERALEKFHRVSKQRDKQRGSGSKGHSRKSFGMFDKGRYSKLFFKERDMGQVDSLFDEYVNQVFKKPEEGAEYKMSYFNPVTGYFESGEPSQDVSMSIDWNSEDSLLVDSDRLSVPMDIEVSSGGIWNDKWKSQRRRYQQVDAAELDDLQERIDYLAELTESILSLQSENTFWSQTLSQVYSSLSESN
eukprot:TRINITY_DN12157_c0_g1_i1.p1 TRINITY_DN12157_c0_g1~~TRINITY_DN12157_c0_g1_i1.p1  ORF type:complete len:295 (+),score=74.28 TRINITY_DN12157_c0_g1_i1:52-936(+)